MSLIMGVFDPKFVIHKTGQIDDVIDDVEEFEEPKIIYTPDLKSHEMQDGTLRRKLLGFRFRCEMYFKIVNGSQLIKLARLYHQVVANGVAGYDSIDFYPYQLDKPLYFEDVTIDDADIEIQYLNLQMHKDFTLKLIGRNRVDWVPLALADFTMWGNVSLTIEEITQTFDELT